ncbi:MAG: hypothetical protein ACXQS5_03890 [Candidatus Methanospirareceae archaeon]
MWTEIAVIVVLAVFSIIATQMKTTTAVKALLAGLEFVILLLYLQNYGVNWLVVIAAVFSIAATAASLYEY